MSVVIRAHFDGKTIVPDSQVDLPTDQALEVELRLLPKIDLAPAVSETAPGEHFDIRTLPMFGMWADREDITDSAEWVHKEREKWSNRHSDAD